MALATLLGGTGFVGRALAARLQADGWAVRVCARHPEAADLPQAVALRACDVRVAAQLREAVAGSDAVVYLPGAVRAQSLQSFADLHAEAPRDAAASAREAGASRFLFLSALGVAANAPAAADRTKIAGEAAVQAAFPGARVVRPSLVSGPGDHFVSNTVRLLRDLPVFPLLGGGRTRFEPLHVDDLAAGLAAVLARPGGEVTYEAAGPEVWTLAELVRAIRSEAGLGTPLLTLPFALSAALARIAALLPAPPLDIEQVRLLRSDKIAGGRLPGLAELGVSPRRFAAGLPATVAAALAGSDVRA